MRKTGDTYVQGRHQDCAPSSSCAHGALEFWERKSHISEGPQCGGANEPVQVEHEGAKGIIMLCRKLLNQVGVFGALDDGVLNGRREYELVVKGKCQ